MEKNTSLPEQEVKINNNPKHAFSDAKGRPGKLDEMRFDYAWKWFNFHADQRTKMFNFMLIGMGIVANALVTAIDKSLTLMVLLISFLGIWSAIGFILIDRRNQQLYKVAMHVLIQAEREYLFVPSRTMNQSEDSRSASPVKYERDSEDLYYEGISGRIALADKRGSVEGSSNNLTSRRFKEFFEGRHRIWMPAIAYGFLVLSLVTLCWSAGEILGIKVIQKSETPEKVTIVCSGSSCALTTEKNDQGQGQLSSIAPHLQLDIGSITLNNSSIISILLGALLITSGFILIIAHKRTTGIILILLGTGSAAWGISIPITGKLELKPEFSAKLADSIELKLEQKFGSNGLNKPGLLAASRFAGFASGSEKLNCDDPANIREIKITKDAISKAKERKQPIVMILVGSTDKTPLTPPNKERFESNTGLARARVNQVEQCLGIDTRMGSTGQGVDVQVMRLVTGPLYTPLARPVRDLAKQLMAEDREVRVLLIGLSGQN